MVGQINRVNTSTAYQSINTAPIFSTKFPTSKQDVLIAQAITKNAPWCKNFEEDIISDAENTSNMLNNLLEKGHAYGELTQTMTKICDTTIKRITNYFNNDNCPDKSPEINIMLEKIQKIKAVVEDQHNLSIKIKNKIKILNAQLKTLIKSTKHTSPTQYRENARRSEQQIRQQQYNEKNTIGQINGKPIILPPALSGINDALNAPFVKELFEGIGALGIGLGLGGAMQKNP